MSQALQTIAGFFTKGGIFMWPLLVCSIVSLTVIILRTLALREKNVLPLTIESEMEGLAPAANPERHRSRPRNRRPKFGRVRLFFEESGSPFSGNGIARDGSAFKVLPRPARRWASQDAGPRADGDAGGARDAGNRADGVTQDRHL